MTDAPSDRSSLTRDGTWSEPQHDWLPVVRAVFCFVIAQTDGKLIVESHQDDLKPFSIEAFEQFKNRQNNADADIVSVDTDPLSLYNLKKTLRDSSRACQAEIDLDKACFNFAFAGGGIAVGFAPWNLAPLRGPVEIDPRLELEARFNKGSGLTVITDEEAKQGAQQYEAARAAASFVWNRLMLPAFDRLVSAGRVKVYARVQSRMAQFQQLPTVLWSRLEASGCYNGGAARDPEGELLLFDPCCKEPTAGLAAVFASFVRAGYRHGLEQNAEFKAPHE